jgi:heptosyltransferase-2
MTYKPDCRYFNGEKPCEFKRLCDDCPEYKPMGVRILILKLAAMGDVLRTTPLLSELKSRHPESHITWVVEAPSFGLLYGLDNIDRLFSYNDEVCRQLEVEKFDLILSLDKDIRTAALAMKIEGSEKKGFGLSAFGNIFPLNSESEYAFQLGIDDELKFRKNQKTYQEIIFEAVGYKYTKQPYELFTGEDNNNYANQFFQDLGSDDRPVVAICPGAGPLFANKAWTIEGYCRLIDALASQGKAQLLLLGGKAEKEKNSQIYSKVSNKINNGGNDHSISQFSAIISKCDLMISGDTLPMHLAIGHGKHVLALFGPTCSQEIDLYDKGEIIVSPIECAPCYRKTCDIVEHCMIQITSEVVIDKALKLVEELQ